jgi:hypothetical protein
MQKNSCIICEKEANAKNSHIVPMNLIKDCIGKRHNEVSHTIDLLNYKNEIYLGDNIKHKNLEYNSKGLKELSKNPYTLDNILCSSCEKDFRIIKK